MTCTSKLGWQGTNAIWELPVVEHRLDIGLRLLLWERRESPVVYSDLYLPVGSVNDPPGLSGMAHFVEHMLFKGTRRFPKGAIDRLTFLAGGQANAETDEDSTHFWFGLPSTHLELALVLESDRLRHSRFDPAEVESERGVIAEESRRELDQPWSRLERAHLAACFPGHPYRYPVLGLSEDLARITAADLRQFHRERYGPDGATLVVVGDFEATRLIDQVNEHFGQIPPVASGRRSREPEAPLAAGPLPGAKLELPGVDTILRGLLGWRTCPRTDADSAALEVLAELLGSGRGSRLWRKLVHRRQLATSADASHEPSLLDGVFYIGIEAERRVDHRRIVDAVLADLADLARRGPSLLELERVRQRLSAGWLWELDDLGASASGLGHASLAGDWRRWPQEYQAALRVEPGDIRRVIRTYLKPDTLIEGWLLTQSTRGQIQVPSAPESAVVAGNSTSKDPFQPGRFTGLFAGLVRVPGNPALG